MNRRVDRGALGGVADRGVAAVDVAQLAAAAHERFDVAVFAGELYGGFHVVFQPLVLCEIVFDEFFGFGAFDAELVAEVGGAGAVNDAEIDGFGGAALVGRAAGA